MITWIPYPNRDRGEHASAQGFILTAGHDGTWAVWPSRDRSKDMEALLSGAVPQVMDERSRTSADLWPMNPSKNLEQAKQAAEVALNEMIA
jgi:hypothetical protein